MARGFGATRGVGTTDAITTLLTAHATLRSYAVWTFRNGDGGGDLGQIFNKRTNLVTSQREAAYNDLTLIRYVYSRQWGAVQATWIIDRPAASEWHHFGVSYDSGSDANEPVMYLDGVSVAVTEAIAPSGSLGSNTAAYVLGNRTNDNLRVWDGDLCEFAIWDRILTAAEFAALGKGYSPLFFPQSLVCYAPLVRETEERVQGEPTVTGTAVQTHPKVIYPEPRWTMFTPPHDLLPRLPYIERPIYRPSTWRYAR